MAVLLALESKDLLLGESAEPVKVNSIRTLVTSEELVELVGNPWTMHLASNLVLLNLAVEFRSGISIEELESAVQRIKKHIQAKHPEAIRIFIEAAWVKSEKRSKGS